MVLKLWKIIDSNLYKFMEVESYSHIPVSEKMEQGKRNHLIISRLPVEPLFTEPIIHLWTTFTLWIVLFMTCSVFR